MKLIAKVAAVIFATMVAHEFFMIWRDAAQERQNWEQPGEWSGPRNFVQTPRGA